jgi:hypothetical protein
MRPAPSATEGSQGSQGSMGGDLPGVVIGVIIVIWLLASCVGAIF